MLKIVRVRADRESATLKLEGRLLGPWVEELRRACERFLAAGASVTLDLGDMSFADRDGIRLLRSLMDRDVGLTNASGFLAERLRAEEQQWMR